MKEQIFRLVERIRDECVELERVIDRAQEGWRRAKRSADEFYVDGVSLNLHSFYAGVERLFEMIAGTVDGAVPRGRTGTNCCWSRWRKRSLMSARL